MSTDGKERKRGVRWLFAGATAYWTGLAAWTLYTPLSVFLRYKEKSPGHTSLMFNDVLEAKVLVDHETVWSASVTALQALGWIAIPPLLMWAMWLALSARARGQQVTAGEAHGVLTPGRGEDTSFVHRTKEAKVRNAD